MSSLRSTATHTALVIPLPSAEHVCRLASLGVRRRSSAPLAHITLLTPFVDERDIDETVLETLRTALAQASTFSVRLATCGEFDNGWYWIAPDDPSSFIEIIDRLRRAFPNLAPYGGAHREVIPHMSVGVEPDPHIRRQMMTDLTSSLPITAEVTEVLMVRSGPDDWHALHRLALPATTR